MSQQTWKRTTTAHFIRHWGVPKDIHSRASSLGLDLAILEFGPRTGRRTFRFATNGASEYLQGLGEVRYRQELFCSSRSSAHWIVELLQGLADYPVRYLTHLAVFDTLAVQKPIDRGRSPYVGLLVVPPTPGEEETIGAFYRSPDSPVVVNRVIGIYESELEYCYDYGGERLWTELTSTGGCLEIDSERTRLH